MTSAQARSAPTPEALNARGNELVGRGELGRAIAHYREALRLRPDFAVAHNNLGNALSDTGQREEAVSHYREAVRLRPALAGAHDNLGAALKALDRPEEALASFREAIRRDPGFVEGYLNLANLLVEEGELAEAEEILRRALGLRPGLARTHNNLGFALLGLRRPAEALDCFRVALRLRPGDPELHNNAGNAFRDLERLPEAESCYREAIRLSPRSPGAHNNLGNILAERGKLDEAQVAYAEALRLRPDYPEARTNRAHAYLAAGDYARGAPEYEWRLESKAHARDDDAGPRWGGEPLEGRTILLRTEQGFGDTFQFIRYAPLVKARGGRVVLECEPPLLRMLSDVCGVDEVIPLGSPLPSTDLQASLVSLPAIFGTTLETIPAEVPYLAARPDLVARWRSRLESIEGFKVGISWQGNPKYKRDRARSIPLARFEPLARVPGVRLVSLQKGPGADQHRGLAGAFPVVELEGPRDAAEGAFSDTAAIMTGLDLVVTSDTALAHLAGALGVPVWLGLCYAPDWRWMLDRDDSPWYPTMRLFRQPGVDRWSEVFARMAAALEDRFAPARGVGSVAIEVSPGELVDRLTILEIKHERFADPEQLRHVRSDLTRLPAARDRSLPATEPLAALAAELRSINERLWDIENGLRRCEAGGDFGPRFVEMARSVYTQNGRRASVKRQIDQLLGATVFEQKLYR